MIDKIGNHEYTVNVISYTFSGPYGLNLGGKMKNGKLYLTGSLGLHKSINPLSLQLTLIEVKLSPSNAKNTFLRTCDHSNPFSWFKNESNYGKSSFKKNNP